MKTHNDHKGTGVQLLTLRRYCHGIALALVAVMLIPSHAFGDSVATRDSETSRFFHDGWSVSLGLCALSHAGVTRDPLSNGRTDFSLECAIDRSLGPKVIFELGSEISFPHGGIASPSVVLGSVNLRWYPAALRHQRDQFYMQGGVVYLFARQDGGGTRRGGGTEVSLGMDVFLSPHSSLFAGGGLGVVEMSRARIASGTETDPHPPDGPIGVRGIGMLGHLTLGMRFDL